MPPFRPFKPGEFVQNADGTQSTERTITWQLPDGRWVNTPTLFMTPNGVLDLSTPDKEDQARNAALVLMKSGTEFPTFNSPDDAESFATGRSKGGGAFQGSLGRPAGMLNALPLPPPLSGALRPGFPPPLPKGPLRR